MYNNVKPIFKWAGSKKKMFEKYDVYFSHFKNKKLDHFVDYFGGTGIMSVWINKNYPDTKITINEFNSQIFGIYCAIKYDYENFLTLVNKIDKIYMAMPHLLDKTLTKDDINNSERKKFYLSLRNQYASIENIATKKLNTKEAALLYFLMCNNFNGIWQARRSDNVYFTPFGNGWRKNPLMDEYKDALDDFRSMIINADIVCGSFENVKIDTNNTIHYFDPPYVNSHTRYSDDAFNINHTKIMIQMMNYLNDKGKTVIMSNKESDLFNFNKDFTIEKFNVKYTVSSKQSKAVEILVHNISNISKHKGLMNLI